MLWFKKTKKKYHKEYELLVDVNVGYYVLKKGYTDTLEYPTLYDETSGILHICIGHGQYTEITPDMYKINQL